MVKNIYHHSMKSHIENWLGVVLGLGGAWHINNDAIYQSSKRCRHSLLYDIISVRRLSRSARQKSRRIALEQTHQKK